MRWAGALLLLGVASACLAAALKKLPANSFVEIDYTTEQPPGAAR